MKNPLCPLCYIESEERRRQVTRPKPPPPVGILSRGGSIQLLTKDSSSLLGRSLFD
jgi:hypothetical protein